MKPATDGRIFMPPRDPWDAGTFEGAEYENLRRVAAMTFRERLEMLEGMAEVAQLLEDSHKLLLAEGHHPPS